jgi:hypothetical protein
LREKVDIFIDKQEADHFLFCSHTTHHSRLLPIVKLFYTRSITAQMVFGTDHRDWKKNYFLIFNPRHLEKGQPIPLKKVSLYLDLFFLQT